MNEETMLKLAAGSPVAIAILAMAWLFKRSVFPFVEKLWERHEHQQKLNRETADRRTQTGEKLAIEMHRLADKVGAGNNGRRDTDTTQPEKKPRSGQGPVLALLAFALLLLSGCSLNQQLITAAEDYQAAKAADTRDVSEHAFKRLDNGNFVPFWDADEQARKFNTDDDFQAAIIAAKTGKTVKARVLEK